MTQFHADIGWLLGGLRRLRSRWACGSPAPRRPAVRLGWVLLGLIGLQGVIGYTQYFTGLPAGLVWVHVCGSVLIWIAALRLVFALRDRGPVTLAVHRGRGARRPRPGEPAEPAAAR